MLEYARNQYLGPYDYIYPIITHNESVLMNKMISGQLELCAQMLERRSIYDDLKYRPGTLGLDHHVISNMHLLTMMNLDTRRKFVYFDNDIMDDRVVYLIEMRLHPIHGSENVDLSLQNALIGATCLGFKKLIWIPFNDISKCDFSDNSVSREMLSDFISNLTTGEDDE